MDNYEDTVMSKEILLEKLRECKRLYPLRIGYEVEMYIAQAQAGISFNAGYKKGVEDHHECCDLNYKAGYEQGLAVTEKNYLLGWKHGREEVVEEIVKDMDIPVRYNHNATCFDCLERIKGKYISKPN